MSLPNEEFPTYQQDVKQAATILLAHQGPIVVLAHENPDGDALGSMLGLARALRSQGKTVIASMNVPRFLSFLPEEGEVIYPLKTWPEHALAAVVDVDNNDAVRVGGAAIAEFTGQVVNIDHHGTNKRQATVSVVDPSKPAAALMVADVVNAMDIPWTEAIATPLLLGINTDTGSFRFSNVTPETFEWAAKLLSYGARLSWMNEHLGQHPKRYYTMLKEVLDNMQFLHGGRTVIARVDDAMLERGGASWEDTEAYVGLLRGAEGSDLTIMVKDFGDHVKFSLRSKAPVSAQNIAVALGGGGHIPAAGASIAEPFASAWPKLEAAITAEYARVDAS